VDTLDLRPLPGLVLKQFTARDVVSRWYVLEVRTRATSTTAAAFLSTLQARMPFPIRAVQVDGGSEFAADFEQACQQLGFRLFVLPPRSPKLNGHVERANRTHTEEFHEITPTDWRLPALNRQLRAWEQTYNTVPPSSGPRLPHPAGVPPGTPARRYERPRTVTHLLDEYRLLRRRRVHSKDREKYAAAPSAVVGVRGARPVSGAGSCVPVVFRKRAGHDGLLPEHAQRVHAGTPKWARKLLPAKCRREDSRRIAHIARGRRDTWFADRRFAGGDSGLRCDRAGCRVYS